MKKDITLMSSYQTRSKTEKQKMEEAAHILVQLSQASPRASPNASPHASPHAPPVDSCLDSENNDFLDMPPPPHPILYRSLSHGDTANERLLEIAPHTVPGDTVLMNWFVDRCQFATVQYMKNENGTLFFHTIHGPRDSINIAWTYNITNFDF
jgi:hypothetical protein